MRSVFKLLALATSLISGTASAQIIGLGMPSSTPGATTYGSVNPSQGVPAGSMSSTPGYATYGAKTVVGSVGGAPPLQPQAVPTAVVPITNQIPVGNQ